MDFHFRHYPDLGRTSDKLRQIFNQLEVLPRHVISVEFLRSFHYAGKPVMASPNVGCFLTQVKLGTSRNATLEARIMMCNDAKVR